MIERRAIRKRGGIARTITNRQDGSIRGRPVEVKSVKKDNRFRINEHSHRNLVRLKGKYIFVNARGKQKVLSAKTVSKKLSRGKWFKDRRYLHRFIKVKQVF